MQKMIPLDPRETKHVEDSFSPRSLVLVQKSTQSRQRDHETLRKWGVFGNAFRAENAFNIFPFLYLANIFAPDRISFARPVCAWPENAAALVMKFSQFNSIFYDCSSRPARCHWKARHVSPLNGSRRALISLNI